MGRQRVDRQIRKGDLVVTPVARHFVVGRVTADDNTQQFLEWHETREEAVSYARALGDATHRVFVFEHAGQRAYRMLDSASAE